MFHLKSSRIQMIKALELFKNIVIEYFEYIGKSELSKSDDFEKIVYIGLNTITHIFTVSLSKNKNIDITYFNGKQSYYYYIEYIHQIKSTNLVHKLNYTDAAIFVYNKILDTPFEHYDKINKTEYSKETMIELSWLLHNLSNITNLLLLWNINMKIHDRIKILKVHLLAYMQLFNELDKRNYLKYMNLVSEKITMSPAIHMQWLTEFYKCAKKTKNVYTDDEIEYKILLWSLPMYTENHGNDVTGIGQGTKSSLPSLNITNYFFADSKSHPIGYGSIQPTHRDTTLIDNLESEDMSLESFDPIRGIRWPSSNDSPKSSPKNSSKSISNEYISVGIPCLLLKQYNENSLHEFTKWIFSKNE